jgi:dolichol-phosphate mannosyltransferase
MPHTLVVLATFNEIENLPSLVDAIEQALPGADILVIDDNSPDGTGRWCDQRADADTRLHCLHRKGKEGLGSATLTGLRLALERECEVVVTMDADWSHDPQYLSELVKWAESADVAIGSRYCAGGAIQGWPFHRRIVSRAMNGLTRLVLRTPIRDASGAFRAYRSEALRRIDLNQVRAAGYSYLEEIVWLLHRAGCTFVEVPITFHQRRAGASKVSAAEAVAKLTTLFRLTRSRR